MKKLAILGASGGCGTELVKQALAAGHQVVAVVRSADWQAPAGATVKRGALTDQAFVTEAVAGCDVLISALGFRLKGIAPWHSPSDPEFLAQAMRAIVGAAKTHGIRRVFAISAGGVGDSYEQMPGAFKFFIKASALRSVYPRLGEMESVLLSSGLDVCICRPTGLTDGPVTGQTRVVTSLQGRATISRADVAAWLLTQLDANPLAKTPVITVTG